MKLKLSVPAVIKSLEAAVRVENAKLADIQKELDKAKKQQNALIAHLKKNLDSLQIDRIYTYGTSIDFRITGDFSKFGDPELVGRLTRDLQSQTQTINTIQKNIRILNLCTDEHVQSSMLENIVCYL